MNSRTTSKGSIAPGTSSSYSSASAYGYTVSNGEIGTFGWDSSGVARSIQIKSNWTGADNRSADAAIVSNFAGSGYTVAAASVGASSSSNYTRVNLTTSQNGSLSAGRINFYGYPDFQIGATAGTCTANYYINAYYQGNAIRIPVCYP